MTNLTDAIAREMMDTIERERRINLDDLRLAAERVLQRLPPPTMGRIGGFDRARGLDYTGVWFNEASTFPPPPDVHADRQAGMTAYELLCRRMDERVEKQRLAKEHDEQQEMLKAMVRAEADKIVNPPVFVAEPVSRDGFVRYTPEQPVSIGPGTYAFKFVAGDSRKMTLVKIDEEDDRGATGKAGDSDWMVP